MDELEDGFGGEILTLLPGLRRILFLATCSERMQVARGEAGEGLI